MRGSFISRMSERGQIDDMAEVIAYADKKGIDLRGVLFDGKLQEEKEETPPEPDDGTDGGGEETDPDEGGSEGGDETSKGEE